MRKTGGQIIADVFSKEGVKKIFGVPGESYLNVIDALFEHPEIEYLTTRHEGGASFMADGYAKASGEIGVCMATRGPGATNLSIGIHAAKQDSTPLVALIGQVGRPFSGREAFQEIDLVPFFSHLCKWTVEIESAERIPELLHRAFHIARSGRPGPVLVSLPEDMLNDEVGDVTNGPCKVAPIQPDIESVKLAAQKLRQAKKPLIIAGGGVMMSNATPELVQLAEKLQIPVVTAFRRFSAFPNLHQNYAGALESALPDNLLNYIQDCDVVLALGTRLSETTTRDYTLFSKGTRIIQVDISPDVLGKVYTPFLPIVSDAKAFVTEILKVIEPMNNEQRLNNLVEMHDNYIEFSSPEHNDSKDYVDMNSVMYNLVEELPKDAIITSDAGNFNTWVTRYFRYDDGGFYVGTTSGAMGYGLPAAIGAKLANPNKVVVSISGDGGFMMTMQEFEFAVRHIIPVISIIVNNNMLGTIREFQQGKFPNRVIGTELTNPNYAHLAENFGGHGERVERTSDFPIALKRALTARKPALIEVVTNPNILSADHKE
ncbi:acetolactate synthase [Cytobacillus depressus]|uniref:Acetolactate synthase n=1 Tax=Cytobacillus depressus TaxID=1602942 RepID=A0A6L3VBC0_9BACI|nr:thiamine pyrophosphate-dependent enzyme [Cytobacillus depressus]KAB2336812.1 acetolactate synthase [Cytobacillus depressus]